MAQQTAVEWLISKTELNYYSDSDTLLAIEQAKEMEKQQIIGAYWDGGQDVPLARHTCEQYYTETYGK